MRLSGRKRSSYTRNWTQRQRIVLLALLGANFGVFFAQLVVEACPAGLCPGLSGLERCGSERRLCLAIPNGNVLEQRAMAPSWQRSDSLFSRARSGIHSRIAPFSLPLSLRRHRRGTRAPFPDAIQFCFVRRLWGRSRSCRGLRDNPARTRADGPDVFRGSNPPKGEAFGLRRIWNRRCPSLYRPRRRGHSQRISRQFALPAGFTPICLVLAAPLCCSASSANGKWRRNDLTK